MTGSSRILKRLYPETSGRCVLCDVLSPDDFCHFAGDVFCLFASKTRVLTTRNQLERRAWKNFFRAFDKLAANAGTVRVTNAS
jgi:hypothetical protein